MKFQVTFKSPDGVSDSIDQAALDAILEGKDEDFEIAFGNLSREQRRDAIADVKEEMQEFISRWVGGGEYVTIEFNSDTKTAMVVPKFV